tara:strand:- start:1800 stop:2132 length:333 start_codon:yes stop_codon:yes gene_type:complete
MREYCTQSVRIPATNKRDIVSALALIANLLPGKTLTVNKDNDKQGLNFFSKKTFEETKTFPSQYRGPDFIVKQCSKDHYHIQTSAWVDKSLVKQVPDEVKRYQTQQAFVN